MGAVYDPVKDQWTPIQPPSDWNYIGDATATILPNGTLMQVDCCDLPPRAALLDAKTLTWTPTGSGKFDSYQREGLTLLPNGKVLDVDAYQNNYKRDGMHSEVYDPSTGAWSSAGSTVVQLWNWRIAAERTRRTMRLVRRSCDPTERSLPLEQTVAPGTHCDLRFEYRNLDGGS